MKQTALLGLLVAGWLTAARPSVQLSISNPRVERAANGLRVTVDLELDNREPRPLHVDTGCGSHLDALRPEVVLQGGHTLEAHNERVYYCSPYPSAPLVVPRGRTHTALRVFLPSVPATQSLTGARLSLFGRIPSNGPLDVRSNSVALP